MSVRFFKVFDQRKVRARGEGEVDTQLEISRWLGYLKEPKHREVQKDLVEMGRMLSGRVARLEAWRDKAGTVQEEVPLCVCDGMLE